jgi:hypothetical protein
MLNLSRIIVTILCSIWTTLSLGSSFNEKYDVIVLDFHDPGYFRVQYSGEEYELWFHYRTFRFEQLSKMESRFPMTATLSITEDGQVLILDNSTRGKVSGTQVIDKAFKECFASGRTTYDYIDCSSKHLVSLLYQRDGLIAHLKKQELEPELLNLITQIEQSQARSLDQHQKLLQYMDANRSLGSIFRHQYYEEQFKLVEAQIAQLNFLVSTY